MIASSYTFLDSIWTIIIFFIWVMWFMLLFRIWGDIFNRSDLSGVGKTGWLLLTILLPFLGVFIYVMTQNDGMNERALDRARAQQSQMADHIRATAGTSSPAADIEKAKQLLDSGAISQSEFDALKQKALA
jgi:hypothetical protein